MIQSLLHNKGNPDSYFQQLSSRKDMTSAKGCWWTCSASSYMDSWIFTMEAVTKMQNNKLQEISRIKPVRVMVWDEVAFDRSKSPLVFTDVSVEVNMQVYIKMLTEKVLPFHSSRCSVSHIEFNPAALQRYLQRVLGQKHVSTLKFRLCYPVHLRE